MPARTRKTTSTGTTREKRPAPRGPARQRRAEVLHALRGVIGLLHQSARGVEQRTGLTNAQLFILQQLDPATARSINELAALAMTQQSTVSLVVSRLEARGLVRRVRAADDARRVEVTLSPSGRRLLRAAPDPPVARILGALDQLPPATIAALHRGLLAFSAALGVPESAGAMLFEDSPSRAEPARPRRRASG